MLTFSLFTWYHQPSMILNLIPLYIPYLHGSYVLNHLPPKYTLKDMHSLMKHHFHIRHKLYLLTIFLLELTSFFDHHTFVPSSPMAAKPVPQQPATHDPCSLCIIPSVVPPGLIHQPFNLVTITISTNKPSASIPPIAADSPVSVDQVLDTSSTTKYEPTSPATSPPTSRHLMITHSEPGIFKT